MNILALQWPEDQVHSTVGITDTAACDRQPSLDVWHIQSSL